MSTKSSPWNDAGFSTMELIRLVSREHHDKLSKSELPVLKILIEDAGYDATAVVSAATIAERVKVSRKTVLRALRGLTEKKYIESTRTRGAATYSLNVEKIMRGQNKRGQIDVKSGHQGPQEGTKQTVRGDTRDHSIESLRDSERVLESAHASVLPANWQDDYVNCEPPRVCRRLHFLRGWSNEQTQTLSPGSPGTSRAAGAGAPGEL